MVGSFVRVVVVRDVLIHVMFEPMEILQVHEVEMNWPDLEAVALNADADSVKFDAAKRGRYSISMLTARCQIVCMMECRVRLHGCWALFPSHLSP